MEPRLEVFRGEQLAADCDEGLGEPGEIFFAHRQSGGHLVSAKFLQRLRAPTERRDEREPANAAAAPLAHSVLVEADDQGRPMIFPRDARGDDSEHAGMPAPLAEHDRCA